MPRPYHGSALACGSRRGEKAPIPAAMMIARVGKRSSSVSSTKCPSILVQSGHPLAEMRRLAELRRLIAQRLDEILRQHLRVAGDVEDVFLGIEGGELTAELRQRVDDLRRCAAHARVEEREEPRWPSADDRDVLHLVIHC